MELKKYIRDVPDFPKEGILYRDITPLLKDHEAFTYVVNLGGYVDHSNKKKTYDSHYEGCRNLTGIFLDMLKKKLLQEF